MFSFENISANNGWAMALAGALIVMTGLTVLSIVISQLHKLVELIEKRGQSKTPALKKPEKPVEKAPEVSGPPDIKTTAERYRSAAKDLEKEFQLNKLYEIAAREQLPHPHLSIRGLREAGILVPVGDGAFTWSSSTG